MKKIVQRKIQKSKGLLFATLICALLTSCGGQKEVATESYSDPFLSKAGTVQLYHATETGVEADAERYQLKQPDNLSAALEEILEEMTVDEGLSVERYSVDEQKNITLFVTEKDSLTAEKKLLTEAALVRSIQGLDAGNVIISQIDENGNELSTATYTDASFYYYD